LLHDENKAREDHGISEELFAYLRSIASALGLNYTRKMSWMQFARLSLPAVVGVAMLTAGCDDKCTPNDGEPTGVENGTCAPDGESFTDHFSCDGIAGPCPSTDERGASARVSPDASRQDDPDLAWSAQQIRACSCSCCHNDDGLAAHIYSWNFSPAWTDSLNTERLESLATGDGRDDDLSPGENNGFSREISDIPSTDGNRMKAFFQRELSRR
jgi:hypothetical protein